MKGSLGVLRPHVSGQRSVLGVAGLSTLFLAAAELAKPFPLKLVIDRLLAENGAPRPFQVDSGDIYLLAGVAGLVLAIAAVDAIAAYQMELRLRSAGEGIAHSLRVALYAHLQRLSLSFHERRQQGDLVTRATGDVHAVGQLFSESLGALASSALLLVGMLAVSFYIDPVLALAAFSVAPILAVLTFYTRRRVKAAARRQRTKEGEIASLATETLAAMREVKALGSERFERDRLERISEERQWAGLEAARIESRFAGAVDVLGAVGAAAVLVVGVFRVASGAVSPGDLVVMASYARRVHRPLRDLARQAGRVARALVRAERIAEVLASDDVLEERPAAHDGPRARGELELDSVTFSYAPERPVLTGLSLRVPAGQKLALFGASGVGKSTLVALLARFYDPDSGRVLIDGRDLRDCSLAWLRAQVGLVLQETILFTGTVAENIAYGTTAGRRELVRAAKAAGAHSFIVELPDGYDTLLGPRGAALSGGQRQRIAIARTLLRDPPVLILDEPTASLDERSEAEVVAGLETLVEGRTTVIISHSPALARWADRVIVLDAGQAVREAAPGPYVPARATSHSRMGASDHPLRPPIPDDPALPQMRRLLAADEMAEVLQRALGDAAPALKAGIRYLRYKPETNLVVHYELELDGDRHDATVMIASRDYLERRAAKPENRALAQLVDGRSPASTPLVFDPDVGCMIQWYPLDLALPALAEPPDALCRRLRSLGVSMPLEGKEPVRLAYKPRRRAVLALGGRVLKCYAKEGDFAAAATALQVSSELRAVTVPRFEGAVASQRVTAQSFLPGRPVAGAEEAASPAGALLRALHAAELEATLPVAAPEQQLAAAAASARLVVAIAPALKPRVENLLRELEQAIPDPGELVPSHGDFNARQLLLVGGELALTDFDEFRLAPPALDAATYVAYIVRGEPAQVDAGAGVLEALLAGYGSRPDGLSWYLATMILRRAPRPFRYFEPEWPQRVEAMLDAAEDALTW
jgi:ATP-binding cassette subfamily B protein